MTKSRISSTRSVGDSRTAELAAGPNGARVPAGPAVGRVSPPGNIAGPLEIRGPSWLKLSGGMVIGALIEARLFGKRLLTLEADVTVLPAGSDEAGGRPAAASARWPSSRAAGYGRVAGGLGSLRSAADHGAAHDERLARTARSLEQAAGELARARSAMP
jgi:hypothetical protein